jgi:spermidine synthase
VIELAREYFFLRETNRLRVVARDGRIFLARSQELYDVIMIDAYHASFVPFHLLTREFFQLVEDHLAPGGVVAQNILPGSMLFEPAIATLQAVFDHVDIYEAAANFVAIAYNGPRRNRQDLLRQAREFDALHSQRYPMAAMIPRRQEMDRIDARVLTDDFAPVEMLNATERNNRAPGAN